MGRGHAQPAVLEEKFVFAIALQDGPCVTDDRKSQSVDDDCRAVKVPRLQGGGRCSMNQLMVDDAQDADVQGTVGATSRYVVQVVHVDHLRLYVPRHRREEGAPADLTGWPPRR